MEHDILLKYLPAFCVTGNTQQEYTIFSRWFQELGIQFPASSSKEFIYRYSDWLYDQKILNELFKSESDEYCLVSIPEPVENDAISHVEKISLFDYVPYDLDKIYTVLSKIGWIYPKDVIGTETDCIFTQAITHVFIKNHGSQEYISLIKDMVKNSILGRKNWE